MCAHYIRMGRMCRQKCSIHSLSGTLGRGGGGIQIYLDVCLERGWYTALAWKGDFC